MREIFCKNVLKLKKFDCEKIKNIETWLLWNSVAYKVKTCGFVALNIFFFIDTQGPWVIVHEKNCVSLYDKISC